MRTLIAAVLLTALVGCGKKQEAAAPPPVGSNTTAAVTSSTGTNADAANALRAAEQEKIAKPDLSVPKENYTAVTRTPGDLWATYVAVAFDDRTLDDKELLNLFSPRYFNEADAFKKQEIAASELAPIKERLAAYKKQRYYSIPFGLNDRQVINPLISFAGSYDFDKKSFPLNGDCGTQNMIYSTVQNIQVKFGGGETLCHLNVPDIEAAKKIEGLRSSNKANLKGTMYFFVRQIERGTSIDAQLTAISFGVWDKPNYLPGGNQIATFEEKL